MLDAELGQMFNFRGAIHWKRQNWAAAEENFVNSYSHFAKSSEFQQGLIDDITAVTRSTFAFSWLPLHLAATYASVFLCRCRGHHEEAG